VAVAFMVAPVLFETSSILLLALKLDKLILEIMFPLSEIATSAIASKGLFYHFAGTESCHLFHKNFRSHMITRVQYTIAMSPF
jgi:hypothetical protein